MPRKPRGDRALTSAQRSALQRRREIANKEALATTLQRCVPLVAEKEPALAEYAGALADRTLQDLGRRS
jgi:hypothetical protein